MDDSVKSEVDATHRREGELPSLEELLKVLDKHGVLARGMLPHQIDRELRAWDAVRGLWSEACTIAIRHCPVEFGESHIKQGIPRLAARCLAAELHVEEAEARVIANRQDFLRVQTLLAQAERELNELREYELRVAYIAGVVYEPEGHAVIPGPREAVAHRLEAHRHRADMLADRAMRRCQTCRHWNSELGECREMRRETTGDWFCADWRQRL